MKSSEETICVILGGGGHASVLIDCMQTSGLAVPYAILDSNPTVWGSELLGVPIVGGDELLCEMMGRGVNSFVVGLGSASDNGPRKRLYDLGISHELSPLTVVHPAAVCSRWAVIADGSQLFAGSIVNARARLGANVIVNSGAIVEHDCDLGDHVHVATGARLAGGVQIGTRAFIGAGATVKHSIVVGEGAVVGAGAVVVDDVDPNTVVAGVPAGPLR